MGVTSTSPLPIPSPAYQHYARAMADRRSDASLKPLWRATVALAVLLGGVVRLAPVLGVDFPLNDGGLYYLMTAELREKGYALPAFTSHNAAGIPYAHPPLGFYLAGLVADATGSGLLDVVRVLPAVVSTLTIPVFFLLARGLLGSSGAGAIATVAFALLPGTFSGFVMGGGLARAPGFLFALLALHQARLMFTRPERRYVATTAAAGAAALMSHLESGWFAAYGAALLFLLYGRHRQGMTRTLAAGAGVVALSAPWWATVLLRHGLQPLRAARPGEVATNSTWLTTFNFTDEPQLTLFGVLGLVGLFVALADRRWLFPLWLGAIYLLDPRSPTMAAAVPLAMLVALALHRVVLPGIFRVARTDGSMSTRVPRHANTYARILAGALLACLTAYAFLGARRMRDVDEGFRPLGAEDRATLDWVARNTSPDASILVLTFEPESFEYHRLSEWMPALGRRATVATVQGDEWLSGRDADRLSRRGDLRSCATRDIACVEGWARASGTQYSHVLLRKERCCSTLESSLRSSSAYRVVADRPDAVVFAHVAPATEAE
jgi:hypothetical protein